MSEAAVYNSSPSVRERNNRPASSRAGGDSGEGVKEKLLTFAKELRKNQTDAEKLMWQFLRNRQLLDLKFRRQHTVEGYIADFACTDHRIIIELDGGQHNTDDGIAKDATRTAKLEAAGWQVIRFWNNEVLQNLEGVAQFLMVTLTPTLSLNEGEGGKGCAEGSEIYKVKKVG